MLGYHLFMTGFLLVNDVWEDAAAKDITSWYGVLRRVYERRLVVDVLGHECCRGRRNHFVTAHATETHSHTLNSTTAVHLGHRIIMMLRIQCVLM